uniref:Putative conjugative transfer protein n=1 Tax=Vibrio harveyi TaxID=669 RepID=E5G5K2_VIBHA|nr:putative conjugative transfer protein [Vibrio harveyi]
MFDKQIERFNAFKKRIFKDADGDFDNGGDVNATTQKRNRRITLVVLLVLGAIAFVVWRLTLPAQEPTNDEESIGFGAVVTDDFTDKDNQSALTFQQDKINQIEQSLTGLEGTIGRFGETLKNELASIKSAAQHDQESKFSALEQEMQAQIEAVTQLKAQLEAQLQESQQANNDTNAQGGKPFGAYRTPPRASIDTPHEGDIDDFATTADTRV